MGRMESEILWTFLPLGGGRSVYSFYAENSLITRKEIRARIRIIMNEIPSLARKRVDIKFLKFNYTYMGLLAPISLNKC